ncbi:uncharacterized protein LOC129909604 [Episyrphus balteatus]|uniref:uncharacterized protein LOC129909604 n=1 Tax=Episyrphus balteatus TaxID=286459 RepID=UPI0024852FA0|nr:uncharacterized protein LOC129909604 [Episyrphus balteatus]
MLFVNESCECKEQLNLLIEGFWVREFVLVFAKNHEKLQQSFKYFIKEKFTRIFGIIESNSLYACFPYANNLVQKVPAKPPIPHALKNLNRFPIRTAFIREFPRVYGYEKNGKEYVGGYVAKFFGEFVRRRNATAVRVKIKNLQNQFVAAITNATLNGEVDISMYSYDTMKGLQLSYPFEILNWIILTPLNGHIDPNEYFLRPFSSTVWFLTVIAFIYIVGMNVLKNICCDRPAEIWRSFCLIYIRMLSFPIPAPDTHEYRLQIQVLIFAFVLGNIYLAFLTSFLTVYIKVHQFQSIEDLIEHNFPVLMVNYEWERVSAPGDHPINLERVAKIVDHSYFTMEAYTFGNKSRALAIGSDKANFLIEYEKSKSMHIVRGSLENFFLGLLMM